MANPDEMYSAILTRLMDAVPSDVDKREGSIIYNALVPVAMECQQIYEELADVIVQTFADTADLDYLILRARERGVIWKEATKAVLTATLTFSNSIVSEPTVVGSVFGVENTTLFYDVTEKVSYNSATKVGVYRIACRDTGTIGNIASGNLLLEDTEDDDIVENITTAVISGIYTSARDDEDVEVFRARYFDSIENESFGGNIADYKEKALELSQVGAVKIIPVWNGAGTVKVMFLNASMGIPTASEISAVQTAFDPTPQSQGYGLAPIGHTVTVVAATSETMNVVATATFATGYDWESLYDSILAVCNDYFLGLRSTWETEIVTVSPGVLAYLVKMNVSQVSTFSCSINSHTSDFVLTSDKAPVMGTLTEAE